jgi:penicillin amidase
MKFLKWALVILVLLLLAVITSGYWFLNSSKPKYHGEITTSHLENEVEIYFDAFGIPHIYAQNETDAYFALGYVHAQDRLFQMELLRRIGAGRLAEIFGPALVETDQFLRTIGLEEMAQHSAQEYLSSQQEPFQKAAFAYLNGINAFMEAGPTPPEFVLLGIPKEPFTTADFYRIVGYMGFNFNTALRTDPLLTAIAGRLGMDHLDDLVLNTIGSNTTIPTYGEDTIMIQVLSQKITDVLGALPIAPWMGSNSWVVDGNKTKSGYPMLANDTHIGFSQPSVWYEAHLEAPGFSFYGNHLAGFPFGLVGHTKFCAWGLTIFPNDDMDFYRERTNPNNPKQVWNRDHWEALQTRKEIIQVKGSEDVEVEIESSRHGPIVNPVNDLLDSLEHQPVSLFWTYLKFPSKALQTAYGMAHSDNMVAFRQAVAQLEAPGLNITYADHEGNIAWWTVARLLERPEHVEPKLLLDGASGLDDPLGWYPFESNPKSENPPDGFVYSANNQPDSALGVLHPGYYYPGLRGQRIIELLSQKSDWDLESFKQMIFDDKSPEYPKYSQKIIALLEEDLNGAERQVSEILKSWGGEHGFKQVGPTIYYKLVNNILRNTFEDELGKESFSVFITTQVSRRSFPNLLDNDSSVWWDNVRTEGVENRKMVVNTSFKETVQQLSELLGPDISQWYWEKVHLLEHVHAIGRQKPFDKLFNVGPFPVTGGDEVINKMDFDENVFPYRVKSGPAMRIVIDMGDMENSISINPTGQSGHMMSAHYQDQAEMYNLGQFRPQHMDRKKILEEAKGVLRLQPSYPE